MSDQVVQNEIYARISSEKINLNNLFDFLENPAHGAISTFIGKIRNNNLDKNVLGVTYDVFEPLAIQSFLDISTRAKEIFNCDFKIYIEHFKGHLNVGGISIAIGVSSTHRAEAIEVCHFIIEEIKHNSPIWKQEHYDNHSSEWVKGHALCKKETKTKKYFRNYELYCDK